MTLFNCENTLLAVRPVVGLDCLCFFKRIVEAVNVAK